MIATSPKRRLILWVLLSLLALALVALAMRGYLAGDMLFNFANLMNC